MKKEYVISGKTIDDAKAKAYAQHGQEGELTISVLKEAKKGFLGIGASDAEIKVTVVTEDPISFDSLLKDVKKMKSSPEESRTNAQAPSGKTPAVNRGNERKPAQESRETTEPKKTETKKAPETKTEPTTPGVEPNKSRHKRHKHKKKTNNNMPAQPQEKKPAEKSQPAPSRRSEDTSEMPVVTEEEMACAIEFAEALIRSMDLGAHVEREKAEDGTLLPKLNILGDETGLLIGHHGETLDAIQYLINLSANRKAGDGKEFVKISVDVENYRSRREETLRALANRVAEKCLRTKKNIVLEPMNPYERRIIHSEIQNIENVSTHSVGYDENRKIVVTYEGPDKAPENRSGNRHHHSRSQNSGERKQNDQESLRKAEEAKEALRIYTEEKVAMAQNQVKPEKMTFEDFAAADSADIPFSILNEKKKS